MGLSLPTNLKTPAALAIAGIGLSASLLSAAPARAIGALPVLYGTGLNGSGSPVTPTANPTPGLALDGNWKIAQLPSASPSNGAAPGTGAYLPYDVPNAWIGSSCQTSASCGNSGYGTDNDNTGTTINGVQYRWISASNTNRAFSTGVDAAATNPTFETYSYILQQDFTATAGNYFVSLGLTGDNAVSYYIGGTIDATTDPLNPRIVGGTLIGQKALAQGSLNELVPIVGFASLVDGTNTAWMVVTDNNIATGVIATTASFDTSVPGPLPLLGAGAAFGWSRRLRKRLSRADSSAN